MGGERLLGRPDKVTATACKGELFRVVGADVLVQCSFFRVFFAAGPAGGDRNGEGRKEAGGFIAFKRAGTCTRIRSCDVGFDATFGRRKVVAFRAGEVKGVRMKLSKMPIEVALRGK